MYKERLLEQLTNRTAHIGIVGLGYVGLPLAVAFAEVGFTVTGLDVSAEKVAALNSGHLLRAYVQPRDREPDFREGNRQRQTHVAQSNDTNVSGAVGQLFE